MMSDELMDSQAARPRGLAGGLLSNLMAAFNQGMNLRALEALDVRDGDRVLEIGFGPGRLLEMILNAAKDVRVSGIDHSPLMVEQARIHILRWRGKAGKIDVALGSVTSLPYPNASFEKVCAINSFCYWPNPRKNLAEVKRVLVPGGRLVLVIRVNVPGEVNVFRSISEDLRFAERAKDLMTKCGFRNTSVEVRKARLMKAACVTGIAGTRRFLHERRRSLAPLGGASPTEPSGGRSASIEEVS